LVWVADQNQYRCGALGDAKAQAGFIAGSLVGLRNRVLGRWISAGSGCDCDLDAALSSTIGSPSPNPDSSLHD
jgi:hypothetical protein